MIVKNESHIIQATLTHLLQVFPITYWVIDDTGSTDGTQEIIRNFFSTRGISGELYETPWRDFGWNRTQAFAHAYNKTDYVLVWDADDSVVGKLQLPASLTADSYKCIFGEADGFRYQRLQIFNNRRRWRYVGVLHEYPALVEGEPPATEGTITGDYYFVSGRTGARNKNPLKYQHDAEVLEHALAEEPTNDRYMFYCANSYMNAGNPDKAIEWFKKRIAAGGWKEEIYVSAYETGCQYKKKGDISNAIRYWLEAYEHNPQRGESLYELVKHYREKAQWHLAFFFYEKLKILKPVEGALFAKNGVYGYLREYEFSIIAYYMKLPINHREYLNLLSTSYLTNNLLSNYKFYVQKLSQLAPTIQDIDFTDKRELTVSGRPVDTFRSSSPCIIPWSSPTHPSVKYLMNVRYVNYLISPTGAYNFQHSDGKIVTLNRTILLNASMSDVSDNMFTEAENPHLRYRGVEDVRVFCPSPLSTDLQFIGTVEHNASGNITIGTGAYDLSANKLVPHYFESPSGRTCEKNWVPFPDSDGYVRRFIYDWSPLTVARITTDTKSIIESRTTNNVPGFFKLLRGSTCGVPVGDNELWFVCHMVDYSTPRHYYHIIVVLDRSTLTYCRHSTLFKFHGDPIEYCLGLIVEPTRLLFSYSRWDRSSAVMLVPRVEFENRFMSLL